MGRNGPKSESLTMTAKNFTGLVREGVANLIPLVEATQALMATGCSSLLDSFLTFQGGIRPAHAHFPIIASYTSVTKAEAAGKKPKRAKAPAKTAPKPVEATAYPLGVHAFFNAFSIEKAATTQGKEQIAKEQVARLYTRYCREDGIPPDGVILEWLKTDCLRPGSVFVDRRICHRAETRRFPRLAEFIPVVLGNYPVKDGKVDNTQAARGMVGDLFKQDHSQKADAQHFGTCNARMADLLERQLAAPTKHPLRDAVAAFAKATLAPVEDPVKLKRFLGGNGEGGNQKTGRTDALTVVIQSGLEDHQPDDLTKHLRDRVRTLRKKAAEQLARHEAHTKSYPEYTNALVGRAFPAAMGMTGTGREYLTDALGKVFTALNGNRKASLNAYTERQTLARELAALPPTPPALARLIDEYRELKLREFKKNGLEKDCFWLNERMIRDYDQLLELRAEDPSAASPEDEVAGDVNFFKHIRELRPAKKDLEVAVRRDDLTRRLSERYFPTLSLPGNLFPFFGPSHPPGEFTPPAIATPDPKWSNRAKAARRQGRPADSPLVQFEAALWNGRAFENCNFAAAADRAVGAFLHTPPAEAPGGLNLPLQALALGAERVTPAYQGMGFQPFMDGGRVYVRMVASFTPPKIPTRKALAARDALHILGVDYGQRNLAHLAEMTVDLKGGGAVPILGCKPGLCVRSFDPSLGPVRDATGREVLTPTPRPATWQEVAMVADLRATTERLGLSGKYPRTFAIEDLSNVQSEVAFHLKKASRAFREGLMPHADLTARFHQAVEVFFGTKFQVLLHGPAAGAFTRPARGSAAPPHCGAGGLGLRRIGNLQALLRALRSIQRNCANEDGTVRHPVHGLGGVVEFVRQKIENVGEERVRLLINRILTAALERGCSVIAIENLSIKTSRGNSRGRNRGIAAWLHRRFFDRLQQRAAEYGILVMHVPAGNTSMKDFTEEAAGRPGPAAFRRGDLKATGEVTASHQNYLLKQYRAARGAKVGPLYDLVAGYKDAPSALRAFLASASDGQVWLPSRQGTTYRRDGLPFADRYPQWDADTGAALTIATRAARYLFGASAPVVASDACEDEA